MWLVCRKQQLCGRDLLYHDHILSIIIVMMNLGLSVCLLLRSQQGAWFSGTREIGAGGRKTGSGRAITRFHSLRFSGTSGADSCGVHVDVTFITLAAPFSRKP